MFAKYCFIPIFCLFSFSSAFALESDDILGCWITEDDESCIQISKTGGLFAGKIIALKDPVYAPGEEKGMDGKPKVDLKNSDPARRSVPVIGLTIMSGFKFDGEGWSEGTIYDPENGKTYKCNVTPAENGTLKVRGFIGISLFGRTTEWKSSRTYKEGRLKELGFRCP